VYVFTESELRTSREMNFVWSPNEITLTLPAIVG
jgi:hypothetical protein